MTHASLPIPPEPSVASPLRPSFPRPSTPVVEELIRLAFDPDPAQLAVLEIPAAADGRVDERPEVECAGMDDESNTGTSGHAARETTGDPFDKDNRSSTRQLLSILGGDNTYRKHARACHRRARARKEEERPDAASRSCLLLHLTDEGPL